MAELNRRILVVDDDPYMLEALKRCLRDHFNVSAESDPQTALGWIRAGERFSVIIADIHMPSMNGVDFLTRVAELTPASIRIAMTGMIDVETRRKTLAQIEVFRYLTKPCSVYHLLDVLDEAVALHQRQAAALDAEIHSDGLASAPESPAAPESPQKSEDPPVRKVTVVPGTGVPFPNVSATYLFHQA